MKSCRTLAIFRFPTETRSSPVMAPFPYGELLNDCAGRSSREETVLVHEMPPTVHWDERIGANPLLTRANALAQAKFHDRRGRFVYRGDNHELRVRTTKAPNGSGTKNAPSAASAPGDLIFRNLFIPPRLARRCSLTRR